MDNFEKNCDNNAESIDNELIWLAECISVRLEIYINNLFDNGDVIPEPPSLSGSSSVYIDFLHKYNFNKFERLLLILALCPHVKPQLLDVFFTRNEQYNRGFTEFGGVTGNNFSGFLPTAETFLFLAAGNNLSVRFNLYSLFDSNSKLFKLNIINLYNFRIDEPKWSCLLNISEEFINLCTIGYSPKPNYSLNFPASLISTELNWDDFVADDLLLQQLKTILLWIEHKDKILYDWNFFSFIKPGYKALFYGPPGTGKTFAANLIGKQAGKDVYRIDLSMVVSKWVGETEKNLARIFDLAENKDWILFFDEAEALFSKRTNTGSSQERYANQEVAYLLQRTDEFSGTIILASNLKANLDEAFTRRFQSIVFFPIPKPKQRLKLWENYLSKNFELDSTIDLATIANEFEIAGGGIINIIKYCAIYSAEFNSKKLNYDILYDAIRKELIKEGKII